MNRLFILFVSIFLFSCTNKEDVPKGILPVDKMERVLWDVIQADEWGEMRAVQDSVVNPLSRNRGLYDTVMSIHGITKEDFIRSIQYYKTRPDLLKPMFDTLQRKTEMMPPAMPVQ